jgi:DNA-binding transcriptional regulator YiaG
MAKCVVVPRQPPRAAAPSKPPNSSRDLRNFSFSWGIGLLAIEQRIIRTSRAHIPVIRNPRKSFPTSVKTIGNAIIVKRKEKGLTQMQLAAMLGVPISLVILWEADLRIPTKTNRQALVKCLGLPQTIIAPKPNI